MSQGVNWWLTAIQLHGYCNKENPQLIEPGQDRVITRSEQLPETRHMRSDATPEFVTNTTEDHLEKWFIFGFRSTGLPQENGK